MVAQKIWDDWSWGTQNFSKIYPFFSEEEFGKLEKTFLDLLEYNI